MKGRNINPIVNRPAAGGENREPARYVLRNELTAADNSVKMLRSGKDAAMIELVEPVTVHVQDDAALRIHFLNQTGHLVEVLHMNHFALAASEVLCYSQRKR